MIDEFAELVLASGVKIAKVILDLVTRITNLGRAVGVHTIVCTQRPATSVLPNSIKVNMPLIIAGRVQSPHQSQVILDNGDASRLPSQPKGRMIYVSGSDRHEIQTPLISDDDVLESVAIAKGKGAGLIKLAGNDVVLEKEALYAYITLKAQSGDLSGLAEELRELGISMKAFRAFVAELKGLGKWIEVAKPPAQVQAVNSVVIPPTEPPAEPIDPEREKMKLAKETLLAIRKKREKQVA